METREGDATSRGAQPRRISAVIAQKQAELGLLAPASPSPPVRTNSGGGGLRVWTPPKKSPAKAERAALSEHAGTPLWPGGTSLLLPRVPVYAATKACDLVTCSIWSLHAMLHTHAVGLRAGLNKLLSYTLQSKPGHGLSLLPSRQHAAQRLAHHHGHSRPA